LSSEADPRTQARLGRYLEEVRRWGARTNLVGSTDAGALEAHLADSLAVSPFLEEGQRVVDLGSGAGFPGVPLAIVRPGLRIVLVEIRERRVHFLRHVVRALDLGCEVWRRSAFDPPDEGFAAVLVRAFATPDRALPVAERWARSGGDVWLWTTAEIPDGFHEVEAVPLGPRGRIARVPVQSVPRGTL
jgi:16S rRNA (guanine527-N7)-methyltransferase